MFFHTERPPTVLGAAQILRDIGREDADLGPLYRRQSKQLRFRVPGWSLVVLLTPLFLALCVFAVLVLYDTTAKVFGAEKKFRLEDIAWSDVGILWVFLLLFLYVFYGLVNLALMCWRALRPFDWVCFLLENANSTPIDRLHELAREYASLAMTATASLQRAESILLRRTLRSHRYGTETAREVDLAQRRDAARALGYAEMLLANPQQDEHKHGEARYLIDRVRVQTMLRDWSCRAELPAELLTMKGIYTSRRRMLGRVVVTVLLPVAAGLAGVYAVVRSESFNGDLDWLIRVFEQS